MMRDLAMLTITRPREAAEQLLSLRLDSGVMWAALVLATVLNALLFSLTNYLFPMQAMPMPGLFGNPILYAMATGGALVITVFVLTWIGNMMGGKGQLADILICLVWLQFMRLLAQGLVVFFMLVLPFAAAGLTLAVMVLSVWILMHFVNAAHRFNSLGKSFALFLLAGLGISFGLALFLALIGVTAQGVPANV